MLTATAEKIFTAVKRIYKDLTALDLTILESAGVDDNKVLNWKNFTKLFSKVGWLMVQSGIIFFLTAMCTTSFTVAVIAQILELHPERKEEFIYANAFVIFFFCFEVGLSISRSSLACFKIRRVQLVTLFHFFLWLLFGLNAFFFFISDIYVLFFIMILIGFNDGAGYVNVMYQLKMSSKIKKAEKELAINITTLLNDTSVLLGALIALTLSFTVFAKYNSD